MRLSPTSSRFSSISRCQKHYATKSRETRGDLEKQNLLGQLAVQFGEATGRYGALRDYIGKVVKVKAGRDDESAGEYVNGESDDAEPSDPAKPREKEIWVRRKPKRTDYESATEAA